MVDDIAANVDLCGPVEIGPGADEDGVGGLDGEEMLGAGEADV